ncbi:MAG: hypothetical protein NVS3B10_14760 [Polyangiales bacterium]
MSPRGPAAAEGRRALLARHVKTIVGITAVVLSIAATRSLVQGSAAVHRADALYAEGEVDGAIALCLRAARLYVPLAPHVRAAYDRLRAIALHAELQGDVETALLGWEAVRAAGRATRTLWTPYADRAREADDHLATLLAARPTGGIQPPEARDALAREHRALLAPETSPRPAVIVALYAGLGAWLLGAWRALGVVEPRTRRAPAQFGFRNVVVERLVLGGALAAIGAGVMLLALARA